VTKSQAAYTIIGPGFSKRATQVISALMLTARASNIFSVSTVCSVGMNVLKNY
jgi:hypothetical protein